MNTTCPECQRQFRSGADEDSKIVDAAGRNWKSCRENAHWKLSFHFRTEHPDAGHLCPHRVESNMSHAREGRDWFEKRDGHDCCSYCGSLSQGEFFTAIDKGAELGPTDKSYKVYVNLPSANPDELRVISVANHKPAGADMPNSAWREVTEENKHLLAEGGWGDDRVGDWFQMAPRGPTVHAKFYFQHLDGTGKQTFAFLLNSKKMRIGMPGYFYTNPYFLRPVTVGEPDAASH